ncbi:helicase-related protein [Vibrio sp. LaRot3]|uniref:helicase-related protein n=1 Tax=Vibrio sp. LaRot3 TaxID=2998829 RepID=UPI0022CE1339|nr:helicase-related protein [Vibrio sp. LaRot3]MDA0147389.1 helicase-related protein [Vibrio sp. LaRot3]
MLQLPIDSLKSDFLNLLKQSDLIVEAETGSGKSTRLPLWAAEYGRVLVVEPRRLACTSLAEFLSKQAGQAIGESIGYSIKLHHCANEQTQVMFVTPGVALRWMSENQLSDFSTIIVDEFHERRWDTDLLVALLKQNKQHRVVLTSATIEGEKLAAYLGAKRLHAEGRVYDVAIGHRAKESRQLPDARHLEQRIRQEVEALLPDCQGDILVFLPGRKEIAQCQSALSHIEEIIVAPLHASVTNQQRDIALNPQGKTKVVLATNVAETSLTIANIVAVIDSGLERRTEQRNGRTTLSLKHISKSSAKQRAGRAGRVMDGLCIRLYGEHAALSEVTPPEMFRESLTEAMLASASCGIALDQLEFLQPLPVRSMEQAKTLLLAMNAITPQGFATEHGKKIYPLPIDALLADLVTRMPTKALQEVMIDYTAILATPGKLYRLKTGEELREQLALQEPLGCDGQLAIKIIRGETLPGVDVDNEALNEARALSSQMREVFELPQLDVASRYEHRQWVNAIATLHPELVFVRRERRQEAFSNGGLEVVLGRESRFSARSEGAIVLDTHSLPGRGVKQTLTLATQMMPFSFEQMKALDIGEWQQGETVCEDGSTQVEMHLVYAGRVIARELQQAEGALAIKPMLEAVKSGDALQGFYSQRKQQIEHWRLYVELGLSDEVKDHQQVTFESWFTEQLIMLELDSMEDLELFSDDDFQFEGIPYWEYEEFAQTYPFTLLLGDLNLDVEYHADKKLVYVIYRDGLRKGDPKRWELPRWKGWRVQYKKASRIINVV